LHAVMLPPSEPGRMLEALAAALDGTGPAIVPVDAGLPEAALAGMLETLAPAALVTSEGTRALQGAGVADDTAVVIATSGSTGEPKGVELTAASLTASATASLRRIGAGPGDRWLCCLPTFHIAGLGVLVRSLVSGTDPVVVEKLDPAALTTSGCRHMSLVPTQLRRLLDAGIRPDGITTVLLGGAAAGHGLLTDAQSAGWRVVTTYGMSETCGGCVYDGVPLDGVRFGFGQAERIEIGGHVLFSRYRLRPDLTSAALVDGWFRTADLGYVDAEGRLVVRGRADDVINTGGEKVVPGEVEAVLGTAAGVADVVVIGVPDAEWGELVTAFVVPADPAAPPGLPELRGIVQQTLSAHAAPKKVFVMQVFPLLPSGKPDRAALRKAAVREGQRRVLYTAQKNLDGGTRQCRGNNLPPSALQDSARCGTCQVRLLGVARASSRWPGRNPRHIRVTTLCAPQSEVSHAEDSDSTVARPRG
jgi:O-succinylbenzoic acid--CoA ligase